MKLILENWREFLKEESEESDSDKIFRLVRAGEGAMARMLVEQMRDTDSPININKDFFTKLYDDLIHRFRLASVQKIPSDYNIRSMDLRFTFNPSKSSDFYKGGGYADWESFQKGLEDFLGGGVSAKFWTSIDSHKYSNILAVGYISDIGWRADTWWSGWERSWNEAGGEGV